MKFSVLFAAFSHNVDPASFLHLGLEFVKSKQKTRKLLSPPPFLVKNTYSVGWADFCIVLFCTDQWVTSGSDRACCPCNLQASLHAYILNSTVYLRNAFS